MAKRHRRLSLGCLAIHQVSGPTPCVRDPPNKWIAGYADEQFEQAHQNSPTQGSPVVSRPAGLVWRVDGATLQTAQSLVWQMPYPLFVSLAPTHAPCELVVAKPMCQVGLYANPTRLTTRNRSAKCWRLASDCNLSDRKAADHQRRVMAVSCPWCLNRISVIPVSRPGSMSYGTVRYFIRSKHTQLVIVKAA